MHSLRVYRIGVDGYAIMYLDNNSTYMQFAFGKERLNERLLKTNIAAAYVGMAFDRVPDVPFRDIKFEKPLKEIMISAVYLHIFYNKVKDEFYGRYENDGLLDNGL